jgi:hypothetical protein
MKVSGIFEKPEIEIFRYTIKLENIQKNICIKINSEVFEHFFLIIKDPDKKIRALITYKTRIKEYIISAVKEDTSNGTVYGRLPGGNWEITVIKPYDITGEFFFEVKTDVNTNKTGYDLELLKTGFDKKYSEDKRWYSGDLHVHSNYSDGRQSFENIFNIIKQKKLDFLFLTDHSIVPTQFYKSEICVIPSTEITFDNLGHINIFGLKDFIDYSVFFKEVSFDKKAEIINEILRHERNSGSLVSVNHPFHPETPFMHNINMENVDLLEVINSPYYHEEVDYNGEAVKFLDYLWLNGLKIFGTGGSDSHKPLKDGRETVGIPLTRIYSDGLSAENLLYAMKKGRIYICEKEGTRIKIYNNGQEILPGSEVTGKVKFLTKAEEDTKWHLVKNGKIIKRKTGKEAEFEFDISEGEFYRVEGCSVKDERITVYVNPVYNGIKSQKKQTWKELMSRYLSGKEGGFF